MDAAKTIAEAQGAPLVKAAEERSSALAEARRQASAARQAEADAAKARQTDAIASTREAIAQAIGANTRVAIARAEGSPTFIYQAIDVETGEIVRQWPMQKFVELLNGIRPGAGDHIAGLVLDSLA
jgi:uncharacterized FlaG/YvyC family protein